MIFAFCTVVVLAAATILLGSFLKTPDITGFCNEPVKHVLFFSLEM